MKTKYLLILFWIPIIVQSQSQKLISIVDLHGKALGGLENLQKMHSYKITMDSQREDGMYSITSTMVRPDKFRIDFTNPNRIMIKSFDGKDGWIVVNGELQQMNAGEVIEMAEEGAFYEELAFAIRDEVDMELLGEELLDGSKVYKIKLVKNNSDEQIYYVNTTTYLIEQVSEYSEDTTYAGTLFTTVMQDYKAFDGVYFPTYMELYANGELFRTYQTTKIEVNPKIDGSFFQSPNPWLNASMQSKLNEFDFWLGEWDVYDFGTDVISGRSSIQKTAGGFGVQEKYFSIPGPFHGGSLNKYNFFKGVWEQFWIDNSGMSHFFTGGYSPQEGMVLKKQDLRGDQITYHLLSYQPLPHGTVRQTWKQSSDEKDWKVVFDGHYKPRQIKNHSE